MQIGERQAQYRPAWPAQPPCDPEDRGASPPEEGKGGDRPCNEPQRDLPLLRGKDGQSREREQQSRRRSKNSGGDAASRPVDNVAKQCPGGNPADSGERP